MCSRVPVCSTWFCVFPESRCVPGVPVCFRSPGVFIESHCVPVFRCIITTTVLMKISVM